MTSNDGQAILELDELLSNGSPELAALADLVLAQVDPAWREQVFAAAAKISSRAGTRSIEAARAPDWLRLGMLTEFVGWVKGTGRTCIHNPNMEHPAPAVAAAWNPGLVVCGAAACTKLLMPPPGSDMDRTCDQCGTVVTGIPGEDPMWNSFIALGLFIYLFGVCDHCLADLPHEWKKKASNDLH